MFQQILTIDRNISLWIYLLLPRFILLDWFSQILNVSFMPFLIWVIILTVFYYQKRQFFFIMLPLFNLIVSGGISNYILKNIFTRFRPCIQHIVINFSCPTDFSFPSGHAATMFAAATSIAILDPKKAVFYYSIALLISLSRIYLGVHYLLDVLSGAIIGILISLLLTKILNRKLSYKKKISTD